jgi:CheY-like chemotaxis protein
MTGTLPTEFYTQFKIYHELMARKVREILLVSSPYDAFIMEEDVSLASRIINEYSGLNLSHPPRVTRISSAREALSLLEHKRFDLVMTMPRVEEMDAFELGLAIKGLDPGLPVIMLAHGVQGTYPVPEGRDPRGIDKIYIWSGNSDLLLALVKSVEDRLNVETDTRKAMVRVLIVVEDSPVYYSSFLPLIYKEIVKQTQAVLISGLNEEHRLLKMRTRPKILLAVNYEEALKLFEQYRSYLFGVISDTRFPREGRVDPDAGVRLLSLVRREIPDLPILLLSAEPENRDKAHAIPASFLDKNSPNLLAEIHDFFLSHLGFGDFVFRMPDGTEIDRARSLRVLEQKLATLPDASLIYHAQHNHFSNWIMSRSEIGLASTFRQRQAGEFSSADDLREYIISHIHALRKLQQKGVVAKFNEQNYDADVMDFVKIGDGSLGGKARGLAFMGMALAQRADFVARYPNVQVSIPKTLVISTEGFEAFMVHNRLEYVAKSDMPDDEIAALFMWAEMPERLVRQLAMFLAQVRSPLSVRSSSLLEDAQFQPYAGLYQTFMIPNNDADDDRRLAQLVLAVKLVYASTFYEGPRSFARSAFNQPQQEAMAVIVQQLAGQAYGEFFYPAISGVAQSHNFYPLGNMKAEEGIAHIAMGLGKTVVEGERTLRFSPRHPETLPQFFSVESTLANAQRHFYALKLTRYPEERYFRAETNLVKREVDEAEGEAPLMTLASTYQPDEQRIRDTAYADGPKVLTFAPVLKYQRFPLPGLIVDLLDMGRRYMGCPVEIEFAVNLSASRRQPDEFYFLQMRPMAVGRDSFEVQITDQDLGRAFCRSGQCLGNGRNSDMRDILYVKPTAFRAEATPAMAEEIGRINADMCREKRPYLLVGPGRWGSADRWLGIPVQWRQISGVGAIVELRNRQLMADPSQGSHFFQNITSLGIPYLTVTEEGEDFFDWPWLENLTASHETAFMRVVQLDRPLVVKVDGRTCRGVLLKPF